MTEKVMYKYMKMKFGNHVIFLQRIESGGTGLGIPDVYYEKYETHGWIENKQIKKYPKDNTIKVPFRPGQMAWIARYRRISQQIFLFLYVENSLWILKGKNIQETYTKEELLKLNIYKRFWNIVDWNTVYYLL